MLKRFGKNLRFGKALRIGLSRDGVTLLQTSGWMRTRVECLADQPLPQTDMASPELIAASLTAILTEAQCAGLPATIVLADEYVRLFMVTPPQNTARLQDCKAAAEIRFRTLYGEPSTGWRIAADWHPLEPFLACALPTPLLDALQQVAAAHRLTLVEIVPQFIAAWNGWRAALSDSAWFGVVRDNAMSIGVIHQKTLHAVRGASMPLEGSSDMAWLPLHIEREALRLNLPTPQQIQLCGQVPGHWRTQSVGSLRCARLDAVQPDRAAAPWSAGAALAHTGLRA